MAWSDNLPINTGYSWKEGTTTGSYNMNYVKTWMEWLVTTDSANNRSIINVKMYSQVIQGGSASDMAKWTTAEDFGYAGYDNGYRVYRNTTYDFNNYNRNCFADATLYVPHNADGTKSITLQTAFTTHSSTVTGGSVSENLTLTAIPRGTELISVTGRNYGYPSTFNLSRKASAFRERVTMTYVGDTLTIKDTDNADVNFTFTLDRNKTPNTAKPSSSTWTIKVYTYNGATLVETKTYSYAWSIKDGDDANYAPVISVNPVCTALNSGWTGAITALGTDTCVAQYSKLRVSANKSDITFKYGASLPNGNDCRKVEFSFGWTVNGKDATNYDTGIIYSAGVVSWTYTVRDSRGFTATKTDTFDVLAYNAPTLDIRSCYRGDSGGTASDSGTYIWVKAKQTINSLNNHNSATIKAQATGFSQVTLTNDTLTCIASSASPSNTYTVTFTLTDLINTRTYYGTIKSEDIPFDLREYGHGVGIGTYATDLDTLKIGYQTLAKKSITVDDDSKVGYTVIGETILQQGSSTYPRSESSYDYQNRRNIVVSGSTKHDYQAVYRTTGFTATDRYYENDVEKYTQRASIEYDKVLFQVNSDIKVRQNTSALKYGDRIFATCNLIDRDSLRQGSLNGNGDEEASTTRLITDFSSEVLGNTTYVWQKTATGGTLQAYLFEYNANREFIQYSSLGIGQTTFTTSANTKYIRLLLEYTNHTTITPSAVSNLQLENGSNESSYAPYAMDNVELTKIAKGWRSVGSFGGSAPAGTTVSFDADDKELMIVPVISNYVFQGANFVIATLRDQDAPCNLASVFQSPTYYAQLSFKRSGNAIALISKTVVGWGASNVGFAIFTRK